MESIAAQIPASSSQLAVYSPRQFIEPSLLSPLTNNVPQPGGLLARMAERLSALQLKHLHLLLILQLQKQSMD